MNRVLHVNDGRKSGGKVLSPCLALPVGKRSGVGCSPVPEYSCVPRSQPSGMTWHLPAMPDQNTEIVVTNVKSAIAEIMIFFFF